MFLNGGVKKTNFVVLWMHVVVCVLFGELGGNKVCKAYVRMCHMFVKLVFMYVRFL